MNRIAGILGIAGLVLTVPWPAAGQRKNMVMQGHAGFAFQEEGNLRPGLEMGIGFAFSCIPRFWLSVEFSRWKSESRTAPGLLFDGTVTVSPILLCLQYDFLNNRFFVPYALVGGAFVFTKFEIDPMITIPEVKINQSIENGPSFYFGLGARIPIARTASFFSEVSYLIRTAPGKTLTDDMNLGRSEDPIVVNLRTVFLKFGLKLFI